MDRPRVLHAYKVYHPDSFGGIPYVISQLLKVAPFEFNQRVIVCSEKYAGDYQVERVHSFGSVSSLPLAPSYPWRLYRALRNTDICILHAPFPLADLALAFFLPPEVKLIVYWHSDIIRQRFAAGILSPIIRRVLDRADKIIVSNESLLVHSSYLHLYKSKCIVIPFPVDVAALGEIGNRKQADSIRRLHPNLIVACGRLVKYKGFDVLIQAARSITAPIVIIGEGPERQRLQYLINAYSLGDRVRLVGAVTDEVRCAYLQAASVFAFPSVSNAETFGIVQLEAMAFGLPVINTALQTAVPAIARHGSEGITIEPGNPALLAEALGLLITRPDLRASLGASGRNRVERDFNFNLYSNAIKSVFMSVLGESVNV